MPFGMLAGADAVGQPAEQRRRRVAIELERLGGVDAPARREPSPAISFDRVIDASA